MLRSYKRLFAVLLLAIVVNARGGVVFDSSTKTAHTGTSGSLSYNAAGTASTALIFTISSGASNSALSGVSYAGSTLSRLAVADGGGAASYVEMWGILNPASGTNAFTFDFAGSVSRVVAAASYDNVTGFGESLTSTVSSGTNLRLTANASTANSTYIFSIANSSSTGGWTTFPTGALTRQNTAGLVPNWALGDVVTGTATAAFTFAKVVGAGNNAGAAVEMQPLNSPTPTITQTRSPTPTISATFTLTATRTASPTRTATRTASPTPSATPSQTACFTSFGVTPQPDQTMVTMDVAPNCFSGNGTFNYGPTSAYGLTTTGSTSCGLCPAHHIVSTPVVPGSNPFHWKFTDTNSFTTADQIFTYPTQTPTPSFTASPSPTNTTVPTATPVPQINTRRRGHS